MRRFGATVVSLIMSAFLLAFAGIAAFGFCGYAIFLALSSVLSPAWAAVATAGAILVVTANVAFLLVWFASRSRARTRRADADIVKILLSIGGIFGRRMHEASGEKAPPLALLAALAAGFAVGFHPALREYLRDLLKL